MVPTGRRGDGLNPERGFGSASKRGVEARSAQSGSSDGPARVGDLLGELLSRLGIDEEIERQEVLVRWPEVVGERIASFARAAAVSRGVLFVKVDSSAWMNELNFMRHDILRRLNGDRDSGRIERIVFTLSEGGSSAGDGQDG